MEGVDAPPRLVWVVVCCYLLIAVTLVGPAHLVAVTDAEKGDTGTEPSVKLVRVHSTGDTKLWPYTSRRQSFDSITLPINVVFEEDAATVRRLLVASTADSDSQWQTTSPDNETVVLNGTDTAWSESHGATRYTYVYTESSGRWLDESAQLHDGSYFGTRYHLRLYEGGGSDRTWTAVQAHEEHWDWFRLRHTVGSLSEARQHVEHGFYGTRYLASIERERYANGDIMDTDGWVTVIDLVDWTTPPVHTVFAPLFLGVAVALTNGLKSFRHRVRESDHLSSLTRHHVALFVAMATIPLAVRVVSIALEQETPLGQSPKSIAALLFPVVVFGLPLAAGVLGRYLQADEGFVTAAVGLGIGFVLDYTYLQITVLPIAVVLHRFCLLLAIGLIAAGGIRWSTDVLNRYGYTAVGSVLWVGALLLSLLGF